MTKVQILFVIIIGFPVCGFLYYYYEKKSFIRKVLKESKNRDTLRYKIFDLCEKIKSINKSQSDDWNSSKESQLTAFFEKKKFERDNLETPHLALDKIYKLITKKELMIVDGDSSLGVTSTSDLFGEDIEINWKRKKWVPKYIKKELPNKSFHIYKSDFIKEISFLLPKKLHCEKIFYHCTLFWQKDMPLDLYPLSLPINIFISLLKFFPRLKDIEINFLSLHEDAIYPGPLSDDHIKNLPSELSELNNYNNIKITLQYNGWISKRGSATVDEDPDTKKTIEYFKNLAKNSKCIKYLRYRQKLVNEYEDFKGVGKGIYDTDWDGNKFNSNYSYKTITLN